MEEYVSLKSFTTMGVGGKARYFTRVTSVDELKEVFQFIKERSLPFFVLGGGSNIVFSDDIFQGVVIKIEIDGIAFSGGKKKVTAIVGAGVVWDDLVVKTVERGLFGLENLSFIPGTVGAAPVQNVGAYGVEAKDVVQSVEVFNIQTGELEIFSNDECTFAYRNSFFKTKEGKKYIVTRVTFILSKKGTVNISYGALKDRLHEKGITCPTAGDVRDAVIVIRKEKLPSHIDGVLGSAGSFFKNPIITKEHYEKIACAYQNIPMFQVENGNVKIPAGWLIDTVCGLRGYREGNVGTYMHQALVVVNHGDASYEEIKKFEEKIIECVKEKTGITLEREVQYVE